MASILETVNALSFISFTVEALLLTPDCEPNLDLKPLPTDPERIWTILTIDYILLTSFFFFFLSNVYPLILKTIKSKIEVLSMIRSNDSYSEMMRLDKSIL